ncbi:MAG: hypothetical protein Q9222_003617 [Ikaeria aurantiellina]
MHADPLTAISSLDLTETQGYQLSQFKRLNTSNLPTLKDMKLNLGPESTVLSMYELMTLKQAKYYLYQFDDEDLSVPLKRAKYYLYQFDDEVLPMTLKQAKYYLYKFDDEDQPHPSSNHEGEHNGRYDGALPWWYSSLHILDTVAPD